MPKSGIVGSYGSSGEHVLSVFQATEAPWKQLVHTEQFAVEQLFQPCYNRGLCMKKGKGCFSVCCVGCFIWMHVVCVVDCVVVYCVWFMWGCPCVLFCLVVSLFCPWLCVCAVLSVCCLVVNACYVCLEVLSVLFMFGVLFCWECMLFVLCGCACVVCTLLWIYVLCVVCVVAWEREISTVDEEMGGNFWVTS